MTAASRALLVHTASTLVPAVLLLHLHWLKTSALVPAIESRSLTILSSSASLAGGLPQPPQRQWERGLGSGVIESSDGYILTSNHVVDKASDIGFFCRTSDSLVTLSLQRECVITELKQANRPSCVAAIQRSCRYQPG